MFTLKNFLRIITIIISVIALVLINTVCKPCHGLMEMPCERSTRIADVLLVIVILSCAVSFVGKRIADIVTAVLTAVLGIFLVFVSKFGHCQVSFMSCNTKTFPALRISGIIIFAVSLLILILTAVRNRKNTSGR